VHTQTDTQSDEYIIFVNSLRSHGRDDSVITANMTLRSALFLI